MSDSVQPAHRYFDAWNRHDAPGIVATFAEGGSYSDPLAQGLTGEAIGAYAAGLWDAFPDLAFESVGQTVTGDGVVAAQWVMKGTNTGPFKGLPPSGRTVALPGADFITVEDGKIRSVQGYFDAGEVPRQLGLQTVVQPTALGAFRFGTAAAVQSGRNDKPGAFSITVLQARSADEVEQVREQARKIAAGMPKMPGFIGWTGMVIGDRMLTVTAWDNPESPRQLIRDTAHRAATQQFFGPALGAAAYTSVWVPERFNPTWVRCTHCQRMTDYDRSGGHCQCGETLPEPPPFW